MTTNAHPPVAPECYKLKKKKPVYKRVWFLILAGIILIAVVTQAGGGDSASPTSPTSGDSAAAPDAPAAPDAVTAGIGQPVRDGKFEFTVNGVDCSKNSLGTNPVSTQASGVFCLVDVAVSNIGNESQMLDSTSQVAYDAAGNKYSTDTEAAFYLDDAGQALFEQLNPGTSVNGVLVFDVPAGTQLTEIELHDSMFSNGVKVALS